MKIKSIAGTNVKGSTFTQPLADITLLHGVNEAGKSTRIETLTLALCKCLPGTASRPSDIYDLLASGTEMTCYAEADDGSYAGATWAKGRKGIETSFEGDLEAPRLLFNTSEFLDLTPKERTKFLFSVLPPPPLDKVGPDAIIANLKNVKCEPHTEHHEAAIKEFSTVVSNSWSGVGTVQDWLAALVEDIANRTKEAKSSAKTMRQTALGTVAMRQDAPALGPVEAAKKKAAEAHTAAVQAEQAALSEFSAAERKVQETKAVADKLVDETATRNQIAELEAQKAAAAKVLPAGLEPTEATMATERPNDTSERAAFNAAQATANATAQKVVSTAAEQQRLAKAIADAKDIIAKPIDEVVMAEINTLETERQILGLVPAPGDPPLANWIMTKPRPSTTGELASKNATAAHADSSNRAVLAATEKVESLRASITAAQAKTTCPTCGHDITEKQKETIHELERQLEAASVALGKANDTKSHNDTAYSLAIDTYNAAVAAGEEWDKRSEELTASNTSAIQAHNERVSNYNSAQAKINAANARIQTLKASIEADTRAVSEATSALPALKQEHAAAELDYTNATTSNSTASTAESVASDALLAATSAITAWDDQNTAIQTGNHAARADWNTRQTTYNLAQSQINTANAKIASLTTAINANTTAREAAAQLPLLVTASQDAAQRYQTAKTNRESAKVTLDAAEVAHRTALADAAAARNAQQATERAEIIEAKAAVGQELRDMLDELLKLSIAQSIGPLVDLTNSLCGGILSAPLTFADGEIQMVKPTGTHSHRSMSGSSKALAYAALSVGLAAGCKIRIVILDELGRLDQNRKMKLVQRISELIQDGKLDQAILADTQPMPATKFTSNVTFTQIEVG